MSDLVPFADGGGGGAGTTTPEVTVTAKRIQPNVTSVSLPTDNVEQSGEKLWVRTWKLTIGPAGGQAEKALDLSQFSFEFDVQMGQSQTPWRARVKVWNPPSTLAAKVGKEYTNCQLDAGYLAPSKQYGTVIQGQINYFRYGKQNATDTFLEMFMAMHDTAFTAAVVNTWIPAGATKDVVLDTLLSVLAPYGVTKGQITKMSQEKSPRGRAIAGMVRDVLRDIARTEDAKWFIDKDGKLHILKQDEVLAMGNVAVPILRPGSGLIDVPTQVLGSGIEAHSLLNPAIRPGGRIKIEKGNIAQLQAVAGTEFFKTQFQSQDPLTASISSTGYYTVGQVKHWGQNRGTPWYSYIVTQALPTMKPSIVTSAV